MSLSPHQIFGRLQELKKWQKTHEKLLQRSGNTGDHERSSLNNEFKHHSLEKVGENPLASTKRHEVDSYNNVEEEYISAPLDKDFEELVEEKLSEFNEYNIQTNNTAVPKKPFLKKGTGLMKYNLKLEEYKKLIGNKYSNTVVPKRSRPNSTQTKKKNVQFQTERPKTTGGVPKTLPSKRTQNTVKSNRPSVPSSQRPKTTGAEYPGRSKTQNTKKAVNNNRQVQSATNGRNQLRKGDGPKQKCPSVENNAKFRPEEPKYEKTEVIRNSKDSAVGESPSKNSENEKVQTAKKCPPKLHDFIEDIVNKPVEYTPLRAPEISIKPRGNWCDIPPNNHQSDVWKNVSNDITLKSDRISSKDVYTATTQCAQILVQSQWKNGLIRQMNEIECKMPEVERIGDSQERKVPPARKSLSYTSNENSLYEKALETELKIFEALERRTEQSGFCSTNTSIIQLLASTPSKFDFKNSEMNTVDHVLDEIIDDGDEEKSPVQDKTEQTSRNDNSDSNDDQELTKFRNFPPSKWQDIENEDHVDEESEDDVESEEEIDKTLEEDFSKYNGDSEKEIDRSEHKRDSSTNTDNPIIFPSSYSSTSSDISDEYFGETTNAYRSSNSPKNHRKLDSSESCASCGFLIKNKIEECQNELDNLKIEKDRIMAIRKQMDKDKKEFEKEMKLRRIQFEEQKLRYQLEIEEERKKMADKLSPEKSNKVVKSKIQQRKDKEEMNNLKMELNEMKELMKLRDTKNAMSIARLRNQVKMLEKNNAELKTENEKLMKEKSKLAAQQRNNNKTTETKMLKEISKNISKLTEETFKNQTFKVDTSSDDNSRKKLTKEVDSQVSIRKSSSNSQGILKNGTQPQVFNKSLIEDYAVEQTNQNGVDDNVEEKYKSLFGGNDVIIEENRRNSNTSFGNTTRQLGLEKTEKILEDGTKEVKYSNGNIKRISENGTVRYYYFSNDTWHTNFPDGTEVLEFPNGQSEKRFKDGKCLIFFPDGLIQTIFPDGTEEVKYPDGSKLLTKADGDRMLFLTNGQVEIHTKDQKRREYPDGTVKILYPDGSQETRYSNGRVRMKNSKGEIILDTGETNL